MSASTVLASLIARALDPIVWRIPGRASHKLHAFARTERASVVDLTEAARLTTSPARAARYLAHASDESRHAEIFTRLSAEHRAEEGKAPIGPVVVDVERLFERLGERDFLAFVHRGEARGLAQFEAHRAYFARRGMDRERALFESVIRDEREHARYSLALLQEIAGSEATLSLRRMALWESYRAFRRSGRALAELAYLVLLVPVYALLAPFTLFRKR